MNSKALTLMGFAKKSGNLVSGVNTCSFNLSRGKVRLMILAEDISQGSEKKSERPEWITLSPEP